MLAARAGHTAPLRELLAAGADIEARDDEGKTALALARFMGEDEAARLLVEAGARDEGGE